MAAKTRLQYDLTTEQLAQLTRHDCLNHPNVYNDAHIVLKAMIKEWVGLRVRPTKGYNWELRCINWEFKNQTHQYAFTGMVLGALLEAGYKLTFKAGRPYLNCSVVRFKHFGRHGVSLPPAHLQYLALKPPVYSEWVMPTDNGHWLPELYTNIQNIQEKYPKQPPRYPNLS